MRETDFITHEEYVGTGYAVPTAASHEAIELVALSEAIVLEPVYAAKAMAGLIDHVRRGEMLPSEDVVFLNTGGMGAVFAHIGQLAALHLPDGVSLRRRPAPIFST